MSAPTSWHVEVWCDGELTRLDHPTFADAVTCTRLATRLNCTSALILQASAMTSRGRPVVGVGATPIYRSEVERAHLTCRTGEWRPAPYPALPGVLAQIAGAALKAADGAPSETGEA